MTESTGTNRGKGGRKLMPTGPQLVIVDWAEKTLSRQKGTSRLSLRLKGALGDAKGIAHNEDVYLTENAQWRLDELCIALGVKGDVDFEDAEAILEAFKDKKMKAFFSEDSYEQNNVTYAARKISSYESLDADVAAKQRAEREARFGGGTPNAGAASGGGEGASEEIPF